MTIKRSSLLINAITMVIIFSAAVSLFNLYRKINEFGMYSTNRFYSILLVDELRKSSEELTRQVRNYAVTGSQAAEDAYNNVLEVRSGQVARPSDSFVAPGQKRVLLDLLKEYGITNEEFSLVEQANSLSDDLVALEVEAMNAVKGIFKDASGQYTIHAASDKELAMSLVFSANYDNEVSKIMAPMSEFEKKVHDRTDKNLTKAYQDENTAVLLAFFSLALVLGFSVINMLFNTFFIVHPIARVTATIKTVVSDGMMHLGRRINIKRKNEIGELADFFNRTFENLGGLIGIITDKSNSLKSIGVDLSSNMNETASAINQITATIQSIKGRVLNQSASVSETHATMEQLVVNINKLNGLVENQSSNVSQASSSIEQMVVNIRSVTDTLVKNEDNVKTLMESSEVGRSGLQGVSGEIQEIARESEGLLEINSVMKNIASQTNLLSMNAAIEAAHAGEAGKGFAVVADEIRKLAVSSSEQSKTIGTVLKKIKESIDKITRSTENVLGKFEAIDSSVNTVAEQERLIRSAMEEQEAGSRQILEGVSNVNEITRQVTDSSHEMLEGAQEVIQESTSLEKATQEITLGMNEIAKGAEQINMAVNHVNDISIKNSEGIETLKKEVSRFTVD